MPDVKRCSWGNASQWDTARLRLLFIGPLLLGIVAVILVLSAMLYHTVQESVHEGVLRLRTSAESFYHESVRYDADALRAVMHALSSNEKLRLALARRDRGELMRLTEPLYQQLNHDFSITHLYFTGTDRVNLLRAHAPQRYGDVIRRVTTLQAEQRGDITYGVELGPLGTFTLRLVSPWFDESHRLIGYVELGIEIDQVLAKLQSFFGVQVVTLIDKTYLDRGRWEAGMRSLGRTPNWERLPAVVTSEQTGKTLSPELVELIARGDFSSRHSIKELMLGGAHYHITTLPMADAGGRRVARMLILADVSAEEYAAEKVFTIGILAMVIAGGTLLIFFYWLVGRIGCRIESYEKKLEALATHDGLTGLYNHRTFYMLLNEELARADRYNKPVSLLMLDIDHFKQVNDTYGHAAGDDVLRDLSERLVSHVRSSDKVCRYGGEEIAIILPEIGSDMLMFAERVCAAVAGAPFMVGADKAITITVSIGAAHYPADARSIEALVDAADAGLYAAKKSGRNRVCAYEAAGPNSASEQ